MALDDRFRRQAIDLMSLFASNPRASSAESCGRPPRERDFQRQ
jgi:hypothetical protein